MDAVAERLLDKAMELSDGKLAETVEWLRAIGGTVTHQTENDAAVVGPSGMTVGLMKQMDPVTCVVQLGLATAGMFWPQVYPGLLKEANKRWKARAAAQREMGSEAVMNRRLGTARGIGTKP